MTVIVTINNHTTASNPRPHILYTVHVTRDGKHTVVDRRYSEFVALNNALKVKDSEATLPPKRILVTSFVPSAWADDELIAERKTGLAEYLTKVVKNPTYQNNPALLEFLVPSGVSVDKAPARFDLEDALPSTLSRKSAANLKKAQALSGGEEVRAKATMIAAAYYPDWSVDQFPPENLDYTKFDILFFAFATPSSSNGLNWDSGSQSSLQRLVTAAHNSGAGTKVVLSVGGWGGSTYFSQAVSSSANRSTFVNALSSAVSTYGLDGIDIDWEYPNSEGAGNPHSPSDAANLLLMLQSLRSALGSSKIISAAVPDLPWLDANGNPLTNVSAYAAQMTYLNIMNYDVFGASSTPGPNAPLGDLCGTSTQPQANAQAALKQWSAAGFPASKMLLGLPLYGYVSQSTKTTLTGSFVDPDDKTRLQSAIKGPRMNPMKGAHPRAKGNKDKVVVKDANLQSWYGQQIPFSSIVASGALVKNSNGTYGQGGGFTMAWDDCSDTPFLYDVSQQTVVTYDDTYSLGDKATFARQNGMAGCFTWSLDQDDGLTLQNAIRSALGK